MEIAIVLAGFVLLFVLLFLEVPIAFGMAFVGFLGFSYLVGLTPALRSIGQVASDTVFNYDFSVLPLFILMGNFIAYSRISQDLYDASNAWLGHFRGGLASATVVASAGFSAVCGSSLATAATMTKVAMPSMRRYGYADSLAAGSIASGGTLGILIPPSVAFVFYGIMTQTDIGKLFAAGILPGILGALLYMGAVWATTRLNPAAGPPAPRKPWRERLYALKGVWGMLLLFTLVMGGLYAGLFTPVEAAGIGASGAFLIALGRRTLSWTLFLRVLVESGRTSAMLFIILIGSLLFANFVNVARFPNLIADGIAGLGLGPYAVMALIVVIYVVLGCILESISMLLLTVPVFYPIIAGLDFGLGSPERTMIWFGVIVVVVIE
ncbi:MAG: TRAP transporter large permease, partial [Rhodospirillaceae bacterium]|nr:TRAP transporter large permease [Rhodospirillaceae bacterium]